MFIQNERQSILRDIIKIEGFIYRQDIVLNDLALRNIIINPATLCVTFIDFEDIIFQHDPDLEELASDKQYTLLCWDTLPDIFMDWVDWDWMPWLYQTFST